MANRARSAITGRYIKKECAKRVSSFTVEELVCLVNKEINPKFEEVTIKLDNIRESLAITRRMVGENTANKKH